MQPTKEKNSLKHKKLLILIVIALSLYLLLEKNNVLQINIKNNHEGGFVEKNVLMTYLPESNPIFYSDNSNEIFFITKDKVSLLNLNGDIIWDYDIKLNSNKIIGKGDVVGVIEYNGNVLYVFNKTGLLYTKNFSNRIFSFNVNKNGFSSVILIDNNQYRIQIFNNSGILIWDFPFNIENEFPVAIDVSDDNRVVVYGTININGILLQSDIFFAYINEVDSIGFENTIFSSRRLENETIGLVSFIGKDTIAVSNEGIYGYNIGGNNLITDVHKIKLNNYIERIDISNNGNLVLVLGLSNGNELGVKNNTLQFYNLKGNLTGEIQMENNITHLSYNLNTAIVGLGRTFFGINSRGKIEWKHEVTKDVKQIIYLNDERTLLVVGNTEAYILERNRW